MFKNNNSHPFLWLLIIVITLFTLLGYTVTLADGVGEVSARAATLYQPDTGSFLYRKNSSKRLPMASTTKIMTAIIAAENAKPSEICEIVPEAVGIEGSSAYLKAGENITVEELLYALLLQSANDAAAALAFHISGSIEDFAALMNEKALKLGLCNTHFTNPHGLDDDEHYTTAEDLAIIASELLKDEYLSKIVSTYKKSFLTESRQRTYVNHNKLLLRYDEAVGVKTGYTKKCGRCLVGAWKSNGLDLITVTLDAPSDWNDHKKLFDYGQSRLERVTLAKKGEFSYTVPVIDGEADFAYIENENEVSLILPKKKRNIRTEIKLHRYLTAPIVEGQRLGEIVFTDDGVELARVGLVAKQSVLKKKSKGLLEKIKEKLF